MVNFVSPGQYFIEKDYSEYTPSINPTIVGLVGFASKGRTNKAILVTSPTQLIAEFGEPSESITGQALEGAIEILETTRSLYFVRAIPSDALDASASLVVGRPPMLWLSSIGSGTTNVYTQINATATDETGTYAASASWILGPQASSVDQSVILNVITSSVPISGQLDSVDRLFWQTYGGASAFLTSQYAGSGANIQANVKVGTDSTGPFLDWSAPVGGPSGIFITPSVSGLPLTAVTTSSVTTYGVSLFASGLTYTAKSLYAGAGYNLSSNNLGFTRGISVELDLQGSATSQLTVNVDGASQEVFSVAVEDGSKNIESVIQLENTSELPNDSDIIKGNFTVTGSDASLTFTGFNEVLSIGTTVGGKFGSTETTTLALLGAKFVNGTYNMAGGTNGTLSTESQVNTAIIGNQAQKTGIYALEEDALDISIAAIPGVTNQSAQNALITLADTNQTMIVAVSPPVGKDSAQDAIDWSNGKSSERTAAINSSYAAIFWPWVKTFSTFDSKDRYYDPAIFAIRQMAFTDSTAEPWFAPAGEQRGRLTKPTEVEVGVSQGDRDTMYSGGNVVNPIVSFSQGGIMIFGQRTAQRSPSATDRINVRRLMLFLRRVVLRSTRRFIFEPNDEFTWNGIKTSLDATLDDVKRRRGLRDFRVICDETTNTPARVDRNELWVKVLLQPTKAAEILVFEFNLTNQSAQLGSTAGISF